MKERVGVNASPALVLARRYRGALNTNSADLHLDLEGEVDVELSFSIAGAFEETNPVDGILFSDDGGEKFVQVLSFKATDWTNNIFGRYPPLDVNALAKANDLRLTSTFVIRFQQRGDGGYDLNIGAGIIIDDVEVRNSKTYYESFPYADNFEKGKLRDMWQHAFADLTAVVGLPEDFTSPMGIVEVRDNVGENDSHGVVLGKRDNKLNPLNGYLSKACFVWPIGWPSHTLMS